MSSSLILNLNKTWRWLEDYYLSLATIPDVSMSECFKVVAQMAFQNTENTFLQHITHNDPNLTDEQNAQVILDTRTMLGKAMSYAVRLLYYEAELYTDPDLITEVIEVGQQGLLVVYFKD